MVDDLDFCISVAAQNAHDAHVLRLDQSLYSLICPDRYFQSAPVIGSRLGYVYLIRRPSVQARKSQEGIKPS
jgi:hypothetical protein